MQDTSNNISGHHFKQKNLAFETTKSVALAGTISAAAFYALMGVFRGSVPSTQMLAQSATFGAAVGALFGHGKYSKTKIFNHKAEALNKYQSNAMIQDDILYQVGGMDYQYHRGKAESLFSNVNITSFVGGFAYDALRRSDRPSAVSSLLNATTSLSAVGWVASHVLGMNHAVKDEKKQLLFAEKVALERASETTAAQLRLM